MKDDPVIRLFLQIAQVIEERLEGTLAGADLSLAKYSAIKQLALADEPLSLSEMATRLVCVRSNISQLVDRKTHWRNLSCTHVEEKKLLVRDVVADTAEELEHRDKVIKVSIGYGYLVVATATQCVIYDVNRWGHPVQFDLRDFVVSLQQSERVFSLTVSPV